MKTIQTGAMLAAVMTLAGCATLDPDSAFYDVAGNVQTRIGHEIAWDQGTDEDTNAKASITTLLAKPLTPASATQIALLNNATLQASYAGLGVAQASLVQAGLLKNPIFDAAVTWTNGAGATPNLAFGVAWSFIDLFNRPLRQAVAESQLEEAKINVAARVVSHAAGTQAAFINYVAARQQARLMSDIERTAKASVVAAKALRKAGNVTALQVESQTALLIQAKLDRSQAQGRQSKTREALNILMGLDDEHASWRAPRALPPLKTSGVRTANAETKAVLKSLDIESARQRLATLGARYKLVKHTSLIPDLEIGTEYEREVEVEGGNTSFRHSVGPTFEAEIPIFDHGQARKAGAYFEIQKAEAELKATIVKVRSAARLTRDELRLAEKTARSFKNDVVPQSKKVLRGTQQDYNAMQQSVFQLVSAKRQEIQARRQQIEAKRAYWHARIRFQQLISGKLPDAESAIPTSMTAALSGAGTQGGH